MSEIIAPQATSIAEFNTVIQESNYMAKIAWLIDPHVNYRNIGYSSDYPTHSLKQISNFGDWCVEAGITDVIIAGDLWDGKQESRKFIGQAFKVFRDLEKKVKNVYYMRGNHEYSPKHPYTMYELTLDAGIFKTANRLEFGDIVILNQDFGTKREDYRIPNIEEELASGKRFIGTFHENIVNPEIIAQQIGDILAPATVDYFYGYELGVVAHIHTPIGLFSSENSGWTTQWYVPGSQGRTQYKEGQIRDEYIVPIVTIDADGKDYEFSQVNLPLVPCTEFFSLGKALEDKKKTADFDNFIQNLADVSIDFIDAADEIAKLEDVDEEVKQVCYSILGRQPSLTKKQSVQITEQTFADSNLDEEF